MNNRLSLLMASIIAMAVLSGCSTKMPTLSEMPTNPKEAKYGVIVYSGKGVHYETTPEKLRANDKGIITAGDDIEGSGGAIWTNTTQRHGLLYNPVGLPFEGTTRPHARVVYPYERKINRIVTGASFWEFVSREKSWIIEPKVFNVNPGEVIYIGHWEADSMSILDSWLIKQKEVIRVSVTDKSAEAWAYIDTLPNIKDWPRRNITEEFEIKSNDELLVMTSKGCIPFKEALKDPSFKVNGSQVCKPTILTTVVNGEKKTEYLNIMFSDYIIKHTGTMKLD